MSVRPTSFDDGAGMWTYVHDDVQPAHTGTLDPATVTYGTNLDGSPNEMIVMVPCPQCDSVSYWPPGGGADALMGQQMHVLKQHEATAALGRGATPTSVADAAEIVKQRVIATDGEQRWVIDDAAIKAVEAARASVSNSGS